MAWGEKSSSGDSVVGPQQFFTISYLPSDTVSKGRGVLLYHCVKVRRGLCEDISTPRGRDYFSAVLVCTRAQSSKVLVSLT